MLALWMKDVAACLLVRAAAIAVLVTLAACSDGGVGPAGSQGAVGEKGDKGDKGDPGSPDDGDALLDKLSSVDGAGSGIDADQLDGYDSSDFALAVERTIQLPFMGDGSGPNPAYATIRFPADVVDDSPLTLRILHVSSGPCFFRLAAAISMRTVGTGGGPTMSDGLGTVAVPSGNFEELVFELPIDPGHIAPGAWAQVSLQRDIVDPADTCISVVGILGMTLTYQTR